MNRPGKISDIQRKEIVKLIKDHIKEEKNCRVGWAAKEIVGTEVQFHILDKISAEIIENLKYTRDPANANFQYDWNIRYNPLFRTSVINTILTAISVIAAIVSAYFAFKND